MSMIEVVIKGKRDQYPFCSFYEERFCISLKGFVQEVVEPGPVRRSLKGMIGTNGERGVANYAARFYEENAQLGDLVYVSYWEDGNLKRKRAKRKAEEEDRADRAHAQKIALDKRLQRAVKAQMSYITLD